MLKMVLIGRVVGRRICSAVVGVAAVCGFIEAAERERLVGQKKAVPVARYLSEGRAGMADLHRFATRGVPSNPNRPPLMV
jgi:hypothetical protein